MWHVGDCGVHVIGKMSKDIGMGVCKGTVVSFVPTLFGCFLGIPSLYVCSFFSFFFCDLFQLCFFWRGGGGRYRAIDPRYTCMYIYIYIATQLIGSNDN